jgi:hypothetical protein
MSETARGPWRRKRLGSSGRTAHPLSILMPKNKAPPGVGGVLLAWLGKDQGVARVAAKHFIPLNSPGPSRQRAYRGCQKPKQNLRYVSPTYQALMPKGRRQRNSSASSYGTCLTPGALLSRMI